VEAIRHVAQNRILVGIFSADLIAMIFGMPRFSGSPLSVFKIGAGGRSVFTRACRRALQGPGCLLETCNDAAWL
jgi:hypothetical protein